MRVKDRTEAPIHWIECSNPRVQRVGTAGSYFLTLLGKAIPDHNIVSSLLRLHLSKSYDTRQHGTVSRYMTFEIPSRT